MDSRTLDFTFDMKAIHHQEVLVEAAQELDALQGHLGPKEPDQVPLGDQLRAFTEDVAEFAAFPDVYKITDRDFLRRGLKVPVRFKQLAEAYNFYWLYFPIALFPKRNWSFHLLEVKVELNPRDQDAGTRPKAYQILPDRKFQKLLEVRNHLDIHIDEDFQFSADTGDLAGQLLTSQAEMQAGVDAKLAAGMGIVAGPFVYRIKQAQIQHTPIGMEKVFWRLDGAEFFQEDDLRLIVIAQAPKGTKEINIVAELQAYRRFDYLSADLQSFVRQLPKVYRNYVTAGMPLRATASWENVTRNT